MVGPSGRHRWRTRLPPLRRARAVGGFGTPHRLAHTGLGQYEMMVGVAHRQLMLQAVLVLAQRVDPASYRGHPLAHVQGEPCKKGRLALPVTGSQHPRDGLTWAAPHLMVAVHAAPAAVRLDDLGLEPVGQGHPTGLGPGPLVMVPLWCHPMATMAQQSRARILEAIGPTHGHSAWGAHAANVGHHPRRHGQGARADSERSEQLALRVHGGPHPVARALKALDGVVVVAPPLLHAAQHSVQRLELPLVDVYVAEQRG